MNIQEMLAKMDSKMLMQGLAQISKGLTAEQLKKAEAVLKGSGAANGLEGGSLDSLQRQLQQNPQLVKKLAQDPEVVAKLQKIIKK